MLQLLKSVLFSPAGSFGSVFGFIVLGGWFMFWLHGKFVAMIAEHKHVNSKCDNH